MEENCSILLNNLNIDCDAEYIIKQALTHSSFCNELELSKEYCNERLEFLGDAVLKIIVSEYLYNQYPSYDEGHLSKIRSVVISDEVLEKIAREINLQEFLILGKNEEKNGGRERSSTIACAFEALLGGLFLAGKYDDAKKLVLDLLKDEIEETDFKGELNNFKAFAEINFNQTAKSSLLLDYDTLTIVYENNIDEKLPIASMVKMMTIYLTLKSIQDGNLSYDQKIVTTENASGMGGSQVFIDPYVSYTVDDLLKSVIMASANDASVALAEAISGSESSFVVLMNSTAKKLGMNNTIYVNCTGLPAPEQYSCARDCAIILKNIISFDGYHKYSNIWIDELVHPSGRKTELVNTNKLVKYYDGCDCGKTGSTSEAGYCLSASAVRNNMRLISVVIGAKTGKDRFKEVTDMFNYGFANYENKYLVKSNEVLKEIKTKMCKEEYAQIIAQEDFITFDKKGNKSSYDLIYDLKDRIGATKVGDKVGELLITKDGNVIKILNLTVKNDVIKMGYKDNIKTIIENW